MKIGIIGTGEDLAIQQAGFAAGGAEIAAIHDPENGSTKNVRETLEIPFEFDRLDRFMDYLGLDAVNVLTRLDRRASDCIESLKAGLHVFAPSPPARSAAEMEEVLSITEAIGKVLLFDFKLRFHPLVQKAHGRSGAFELQLKSLSDSEGLVLEGLDLALYLIGNPEAEGEADRSDGIASFKFMDGRTLMVKLPAGQGEGFSIKSDGRNLELSFGEALETDELSFDGETVKEVSNFSREAEASAKHFSEAMAHRAKPINIPHQALYLMQVAEALDLLKGAAVTTYN